MMAQLSQWVGSLPLSLMMRRITWLIPVLQIVHILSIGIVLSSVVMVDLRLWGYLADRDGGGAQYAVHAVVRDRAGDRHAERDRADDRRAAVMARRRLRGEALHDGGRDNRHHRAPLHAAPQWVGREGRQRAGSARRHGGSCSLDGGYFGRARTLDRGLAWRVNLRATAAFVGVVAFTAVLGRAIPGQPDCGIQSPQYATPGGNAGRAVCRAGSPALLCIWLVGYDEMMAKLASYVARMNPGRLFAANKCQQDRRQ